MKTTIYNTKLPTIPKRHEIVESDIVEHPYEYSCLMVDLPSDSASIVKHWGTKFINVDEMYIDTESGIKGLEDRPHVTIKYGINDVNPTDTMRQVIGSDITFTLGTISKFENELFDIIKVDIDSDCLSQLNNNITENIECTDSFPDYVPHCTIAYVDKGSHNHLLGNDYLSGISIENNMVVFSAKDGTEHELEITQCR